MKKFYVNYLMFPVAVFLVSIYAYAALGQSGEQTQNNLRLPEEVIDKKGFPMVYVPSGNLQIGSTIQAAVMLCQQLSLYRANPQACSADGFDSNNLVTPLQDVQFDAFYIDKFEVSLKAYLECYNAGVCSGNAIKQEIQGRIVGVDLALNNPVVGITFFDAEVFCAWREARLPTEPEWEYAARGPQKFTYPWGNKFDGIKVNFCDQLCVTKGDPNWTDGYKELAPIDSFPAGASWVGAFNMAGNAAEWIDTQPQSGSPDSEADTGIRVQKGGSYLATANWVANWMHLTADALQGSQDTGFRCMRTSHPSI